MDRRELIKLGAGAVASGLAGGTAAASSDTAHLKQVEKWGVFEAEVKGPSTGNPFVDVSFGATFTLGHRDIAVPGFYDGDGIYKVRFSPDTPGRWTFVTTSNVKTLAGTGGGFECVAPAAGNHGPVGTAHQFHFQYADGTPYFPFGTTCYGYGAAQPPLDKLTHETLKSSGFNKVRFHLLAKSTPHKPLPAMPFEHAANPGADGTDNALASFDLTRPDPAFYRMVEARIRGLMFAGIEADLILFNPYDAKGFSSMGREADDHYLRYAIARLSAFRNIWWSIANEYDLVKSKSMTDWDRFFRIVQESDPHGRLRSIHHSRVVYDHSKPWCTHASLQEYDFEKSAERLAAWNKPIIYDEIQYEGDIERRWGNLSPEEMTYRFWRAIINGTYATPYSFFFLTTPFSSLSTTQICCPNPSGPSSTGMNMRPGHFSCATSSS